ncbi:hypothetical protein KNJ79_12935 [Sphingopyxis indica]|uniref:hypothetical protein n=1 Tax=Sphingopyxis indica TaxID=436663 RepID=UPI0029394401|nr:hypothetical protein [Sphingopyxis indica]WOF42117.1 hypothetical protein KNJ79_12935 [Sphingopyxis indica]
MAEDSEISGGRAPLYWAAAFVAAMFGAGFGARFAGLSGFWTMVVMLPPMLLLIPLVRSTERGGNFAGCASPALRRYNRRGLIWAFTYMAALFFAISVNDWLKPEGPLLWLIAVLPALPIVYFVWSLYRYLIEESDEYLRMRYVGHALFGLGLLLIVATVWGFLESFQVVPHVESWMVVPVWAIGLGLAQIAQRVRGA